jgi:hypothetical protein
MLPQAASLQSEKRPSMAIDLTPYRKTIQVSGTAPVSLSVVDIGPLRPPGNGTVV